MAASGHITLTIHGLADFHGEVDGEVFAEKFGAFMRGLGLADEIANGERRHKFVITDLVKNTATARLAEYQTKSGGPATRSGVGAYEGAVDEIRRNTATARLLPMEFVRSVVALNRGVGQRFELGEIKFTDNVIRIDAFLAEQAERVLADI